MASIFKPSHTEPVPDGTTIVTVRGRRWAYWTDGRGRKQTVPVTIPEEGRHAGQRLGILTDLGYPFAELAELMSTLDAAYLESNYDPQMLATGPYPEYLKLRIAGDSGHLSNHEGVELVRPHVGDRLKWLAIAHLSEQNNEPELALSLHRASYGADFPVHLASRYQESAVLTL